MGGRVITVVKVASSNENRGHHGQAAQARQGDKEALPPSFLAHCLIVSTSSRTYPLGLGPHRTSNNPGIPRRHGSAKRSRLNPLEFGP